MYEIIFSQTAETQLKKLDKEIQKRILAVLERIRIRPENYLKKLVNDPGFRLRIGDYRVIVDLEKTKLLILVIKIGHRSKIYQ